MGELVSLLEKKVSPSSGYPGELLSGSVSPQVRCTRWRCFSGMLEGRVRLQVGSSQSTQVQAQHVNESRSPSAAGPLWR